MIGETLAHYRILEKLGAGGMGEVYRAADLKLGRDVAIKVIPKSLAFSEELFARFEREARALAAVDHPNIAAIYSFETVEVEENDEEGSRPVRFLVMQLVEGETLDAIISRGAIPIDEALGIARQIAEALESAHERGIIHRDLKPANVKVDVNGRVRVLDFGLAKFIEAAESSQGTQEPGKRASQTQSSPTMKLSQLTPSSNVEVTRKGTLLGTAAYMSPEQARGLQADERSDIWAFGCVLYEMLAGTRPFGGATLSDCIAQIIEREPDLERLPSSVPPSIRTLIRLCLTKDPKQRLHDMADVRLWLDRWTEIELQTAAVGTVPLWRHAVLWMLAVVGLLAVFWSFMRTSPETRSVHVARLALQTEPLAVGANPFDSIVALSPDGRILAYVAGEGDWGQVYLRYLDSLESVAVAGAERARNPFFSPDGRWLGFDVGDRLMKVPVEGGKAWPICEARGTMGASWSDDGRVIVASSDRLALAPEAGGELETVFRCDPGKGEVWPSWPQVLPDGRSVLFTITDAAGHSREIALLDLETGERTTLIQGGGKARYLSTGHIAYVDDGSLMVLSFDLKKRVTAGKPTAAFDGILMGFPWNPPFAHFTVSRNGTLAYVAGPMLAVGSQLVRVARDGSTTAIGDQMTKIRGPRFSPDGRRIAVSTDIRDEGAHIWVHDLQRGTLARLTTDVQGWWPVWTPDGRDLVFTSLVDNEGVLHRIPADGSAPPEPLNRNTYWQQATSFSSDGRTLILHQNDHPDTRWDVLALDPDDPTESRPLLNSPFSEHLAELSPDGRWIAYTSDESGQLEVYVRSFPDLDRKWQVSSVGGTEPAWSRDGNELYYRDEEGRRLMVVEIVREPDFQPGKPEVLLEGSFVPTPWYGRNYDVAPDGESFIMVRQELGGIDRASLQVVLNWDVEVESIVSESLP